MRHVVASLRNHVFFQGCKHWHRSLLYDNEEMLTKMACPAATHTSSRTGKTAVAMLHLDVFDIDGQVVKESVLVDEVSDSTLFCEIFVRRLRLEGASQTLSIDGVRAVKNKYASRRVELRMRLLLREIITLVGSMIPKVASRVPLIDQGKLNTSWKHLEGLLIEVSGEIVDILLGNDVIHLTTAIETCISRDFESTVSRTRTG